MQFDSQTHRFTDPGPFARIMLLAGIAGLALSAVGYFVDARQFFFSWLVAFTFWTTIGLGGLFITMVHHLTGATWSVVVRRIGEALMCALPWMALFAIPVLLGIGVLYEWTDPEAVAGSEMLSRKAGYLNIPFFVIRTVFYFAVWILLARLLAMKSLAQDAGWDDKRAHSLLTVSGPGMIAFALTVTFAAFDWLMSLQPLWYSTIYGLWFFGGAATSVMAMFAVTVSAIQAKGALTDVITREHRHDIGKLMFAFLVFWGYMHLSQYLLIWYANLPEETAFYKMRWGAGWTAMSWILVAGGFVVPFILLMARGPKRGRSTLAAFAIWLLLMHWVDLYWNIMPALHEQTVILSWMDLTTMAGVGGFFLFFFWRWLTRHPLIPVTDPKLAASIRLVSG